MACSTVSLGDAELRSLTSGTTLKLHSHARFTSSEEDASALKSLTAAALTSTPENRPWFVKGKEYGLKVKLTFDHEMEQTLQDECAEAAATILQKTQLWQGLLLQVTAVRQSQEHDGSSLVEIKLDNLVESVGTTKSSLHNLADGVPLHDISIPPDTKIIACESVCLHMRISTPAECKRGHLQHLDGAQAMPAGGEHPDWCDFDHADIELLDDFAHSSTASQPQDFAQREVSTARRSKTAPMQQHSRLSSEQFRVLKRSYSSGDCQLHSLSSLQLSDFRVLFNTALKFAVSPRNKRSSKEIEVTGVEALQHLTDVMPSLWSCGYLAEASRRAVLLPTICHALSTVGVVNPRSDQLKFKFDELLRRIQAGPHSHDSTGSSRQLNTAQCRVSAHVWTIIQCSLSDRLTDLSFGLDLSGPSVESNFEITHDDELDGYESDAEDSLLEYEQANLNHEAVLDHDIETTHVAAEEAGGMPLSDFVCKGHRDWMVEEDLLSICGSVDWSIMDLDLEMGLETAVSTFDFNNAQTEASIYQPTTKYGGPKDDFSDMISI